MSARPAAALGLAVLLAVAAVGADETTSSPFRKPVQAMPDAEFAETIVDSDLLARSHGNLGAIRVTDEAGRTVPYVIATRPPRIESAEIPIVVVERTRGEGTLSAVMDRGENRNAEATLEIRVNGLTWRVPVSIEASPDRQAWSPVATGEELKALLAPPPAIAGRLRFPADGLRYLRVTLGPGLPDGAEFDRLALSRETRRDEGEWDAIAAVVVRSEVKEERDGAATVTLLDLGRAGLLHERATITLPEADYFRRVEIRTVASDAPEAAWRPLAEGAILKRSRTGETLQRIAYAPSKSRYLQIVVRHGDNRPVAGEIVIEGLRRRIVVPTAARPRFVYYGDSTARPPRYDLADRWIGADAAPGGAAMTLGAEEANPGYVAEPKGTLLERYPWLLTLGLLVGVILLGAIAFGMLKEKKPESA